MSAHVSDGYGNRLDHLGEYLTRRPIEDRLDEPLSTYWLDRLAQHTEDSYMGVPMSKFPEDLRVYEHLLWMDKPNVVIELGTDHGGSALWFRDRLQTLESYGYCSDFAVIMIDTEFRALPSPMGSERRFVQHLVPVTGDVRDADLPELVARVIAKRLPGEKARCLVIEDTAHTYETTTAALEGFSRFVSPGGFFVVEDGCLDVEAMRMTRLEIAKRQRFGKGHRSVRAACAALVNGQPRGVMPAVRDWLAANEDFEQRRDLELYGLTCHPGGFLQRRP